MQNDELADALYAVVRLVPAGRVVTYGDLADLFDVSPRQVGRLMSRNPHEDLPWWRVVSASGELPPPLLARARERWHHEGTPTRSGRGDTDVAERVALRRARADLPALGREVEAALGPLPGISQG